MKLIAGVDIGNSTTEVCIGAVEDSDVFHFLSSASRMTTGTKGTLPNVHGIKAALGEALDAVGRSVADLDLVRLNEAAPVIGDTAMETITETIITESSMIGHNPSTPAGAGEATGELIRLENLEHGVPEKAYIVVAPAGFSYEEVARELNRYFSSRQMKLCLWKTAGTEKSPSWTRFVILTEFLRESRLQSRLRFREPVSGCCPTHMESPHFLS